MKGAGKKTQQSRLAKLHHLILQGNLVLGQFFSVAWRVACWLCLILQRPYRAIIQVGTFAGIVYLVWSSLSQTTVALNIVYSDAATGLENPITVQNKSDLFSVRNIFGNATSLMLNTKDKFALAMLASPSMAT